MKKGLLDTNVLALAEQHYGYKLCPSLWKWFAKMNAKGELYSVGQVLIELKNELAKANEEKTARRNQTLKWLSSMPPIFFMPVDLFISKAMKDVANWTVQQGRHEQSAVDAFFSSADFHLVSYAHAHNMLVITQEVNLNPTHKQNVNTPIHNIKIPYACEALGIECVNIFQYFEQQNITLEVRQKRK